MFSPGALPQLTQEDTSEYISSPPTAKSPSQQHQRTAPRTASELSSTFHERHLGADLQRRYWGPDPVRGDSHAPPCGLLTALSVNRSGVGLQPCLLRIGSSAHVPLENCLHFTRDLCGLSGAEQTPSRPQCGHRSRPGPVSQSVMDSRGRVTWAGPVGTRFRICARIQERSPLATGRSGCQELLVAFPAALGASPSEAQRQN